MRVGEKGLQVVVGPLADQIASAIRLRLHAAEGDGDEVAGGNLLAALGGKSNVRRIEQAAGRLVVTVADASRIDERALVAQGARGVAVASTSSVHLLHEDIAMLEGKLAPLLS